MVKQKSWMVDVDNWPRARPSFDIDIKSTALLIVDMQNFCANLNYGLALVLKDKLPSMYEYFSNRLNLIILNNIKLLDFFRKNNLRVIYTTTGPVLADGSDYFTPRRYRDLEMQQKTGIKTNFHQNTIEAAIISELKPLEGELVIHKTSVGAFNSTGIDQTLRKLKIDSLVITGVATNACVQTTAIDAADRWYKCILIEDACASFREDFHNNALNNFALLFGMVWNTNELINYLKKQKQLL